jgi:tetratricopeptide (TPR) repeat protein
MPTPSPQDTLNQAITDFQNGRPLQARDALKNLIGQDPNHIAAHHILGLIYASTGQVTEGIGFLRKAAELDPNEPSILYNLSKALVDDRQYQEATKCLRHVLAIMPSNADAYLLLGKVYFQIKLFDEAVIQFKEALRIKPNFAEALSNMGNALFELGQYDEALKATEQALIISPSLIQTLSLRGLILKKLGQYENAAESFTKALKISPNEAHLHANLSSTLYDLHRYPEGFATAQRALQLSANTPEIWLLNGIFLKKLQRFEDALQHFEKALEIRREWPEAYLNIGSALHELKQYKNAIQNFDHALALRPDYAQAYTDKASSLFELEDFDAALECCDKAIALKSDYCPTYFTKGCVLASLNRHPVAIDAFEVGISIQPTFFDAHWNQSLSLLLLGNYQKGWERYEFRWTRSNAEKLLYPNIPRLNSIDNLQDKKVVVWHEQGYGDVLQFSRYIPKLIAMGANVTFLVQKPLLELFQNQFNCFMTSDYAPSTPFDYAVPLLSLPKLFNTDLNTIPVQDKFRATNSKVDFWKQKLRLSSHKLNIGLAISGNRNFKLFRDNLVPIELFELLLPSCHFFVVQKDLTEKEQAFIEQHPEIVFLGEEIENFHDTAAILQAMDYVISSDTAIIHLAGSLHIQSFLLLRWNCDWRWFLNRDDSPWYPSVHVLRQPTKGDWGSVIKTLQKKLNDIHAER